MKPQKTIEHREQSPPAAHPQQHLFGCWGLLKLRPEQGVIYEYCERCGRVMGKWAVIPTPPEPQLDTGWHDDEDDVDDGAWGV